MKFFSIILFLELIFLCTVGADYGDFCSTKWGSLGKCMHLGECDLLLKTLQTPEKFKLNRNQAIQSIKAAACGFIRKSPLVCCSEDRSIDENPRVNSNAQPPKNTQARLPIQRPAGFSAISNVKNQQTKSGFLSEPMQVKPSVANTSPRAQPEIPTRVTTPNPQQALDRLSKNCGSTMTRRFFSGNRTDLDDFPWSALLEYNTQTVKVIGCGGSLISDRYVLTAAHCVYNLSHSYKLSSVRLGEYDINSAVDCLHEDESGSTSFCADQPISVPVEGQIIHPDYIQYGLNRFHNIALLRLAHRITYTHYIKPICLPQRPPSIKKYHASGWGKSLSRRGFNLKYMSYLTQQDTKKCNDLYNYRNIRLLEDQICAGGMPNEKSCIGDTGGALMNVEEKMDQSHRITIHGILSTIYLPFGTCLQYSWPGIYTKVYDHVPWIISSMRE